MNKVEREFYKWVVGNGQGTHCWASQQWHLENLYYFRSLM